MLRTQLGFNWWERLTFVFLSIIDVINSLTYSDSTFSEEKTENSEEKLNDNNSKLLDWIFKGYLQEIFVKYLEIKVWALAEEKRRILETEGVGVEGKLKMEIHTEALTFISISNVIFK